MQAFADHCAFTELQPLMKGLWICGFFFSIAFASAWSTNFGLTSRPLSGYTETGDLGFDRLAIVHFTTIEDQQDWVDNG
jgi:hypothetical protein